MKLRSIALSGLLGAGLLMTSGCGVDDVTDAINDIAKPNAVYVVNGYSEGIYASVGGASGVLVDKGALAPFPTEGSDTTAVYYQDFNKQSTSDTKSFAYGNAYLFAASSVCNTNNGGLGIVEDTSTGTGLIEVVNLTTSTAQVPSDIIVTVDNVDHVIVASGTALVSCGKVTSSTRISQLGVQQGSVVSVTMGGLESSPYTVSDNISDSVDIDIVAISETEAVFVPLLKWDDLLIK